MPSGCSSTRGPSWRPLGLWLLAGLLLTQLLCQQVCAKAPAAPKNVPARGKAGETGKKGAVGSSNAVQSRRNRMQNPVANAFKRANAEQAVEDHNALLVLDGGGVFDSHGDETGGGHFLVMPTVEQFNPPKGTIMHGKLPYSDKVMLPKSFLYQVLRRKLEPPWMFEIQPVRRAGVAEEQEEEEKEEEEEEDGTGPPKKPASLKRLYCTYFDFRGPENYVFIPDWMMKALGLRPRDTVKLRHLKLPDGGLVTFQPHSAEFARLANAHAMLETELKYYGSMTMGTTIRVRYNNKDWDLDVVETRDPNDAIVPGIRVADSDVRTDIKASLEEEEEARRQKEANKKVEKGDDGELR